MHYGVKTVAECSSNCWLRYAFEKLLRKINSFSSNSRQHGIVVVQCFETINVDELVSRQEEVQNHNLVILVQLSDKLKNCTFLYMIR